MDDVNSPRKPDAHTHTKASPTSLQHPAMQWNPCNFLLFSTQKPESQQMLSRYHCQLSLLAPSDKTLLSDPDVKEFNLPDAPQELTGRQRDEWASKIPTGLRDEMYYVFFFVGLCCFWSAFSAVRSSASKEALVKRERWAILQQGQKPAWLMGQDNHLIKSLSLIKSCLIS